MILHRAATRAPRIPRTRAGSAALLCAPVLFLAAAAPTMAHAQPITPQVPAPDGSVAVEGRVLVFEFRNERSEPLSCFAAAQFFGLPISHVGMPPFVVAPPWGTARIEIEVPFPGVYRHATSCMIGDEPPPQDPGMLAADLLSPVVTNTDPQVMMHADHIEVHH
ncbi:hypothetical protein HT102_06690 [Hoyosella sp. G463]|uniref:Uncharacterized protein n=1 Tax=Lolliginicoccus lacisalsi TaxID=2742202 RepID=A0A927PM84_9ACTN|nr:hypothetical protein [Lolliginicoccus lacisalsi]MBD8506167.1 hypothetical protein [Lolliginicoccus lacisalsi]